MKILCFVISALMLGQVPVYANDTYSEQVRVEFNILKDDGSSDVKYQLSFYKDHRKIAERVFQRGKIVFSEGDIPDGVVVEYYDSGIVKNVLNYRNGQRNGKAVSFYESGRLRAVVNYKDDNPVGVGRRYHENGNLMAESNMVDGKLKFHKEYYENGQMKEEVYYEGDNIIRKEYDIDGRVIK
jgi:antitoxin component YwqK of YwqJK toxin-antitoxin module